MSQSNIEWTDYTINPGIYGCSKASPACRFCYASGMAKRLAAMGQEAYQGTTDDRGEWTGRVTVDYNRIGPAFATLPKRKPGRVFVTSMSDLFHEDVPDLFIDQVFAQMATRPHLTFLVLTKRAERMARWFLRSARVQWPSNVWAGVTVEDQKRADERIPWLLKVPAPVRFLSMEPLLGPVDLGHVYMYGGGSAISVNPLTGQRNNGQGMRALIGGPARYPRIGWVITGGESGPKARPSHPDWFRSIRDQCATAGVPFMFKQWGRWAARHVIGDDQLRAGWLMCDSSGRKIDMMPVGKRAAGCLLDGVEHNGCPA